MAPHNSSQTRARLLVFSSSLVLHWLLCACRYFLLCVGGALSDAWKRKRRLWVLEVIDHLCTMITMTRVWQEVWSSGQVPIFRMAQREAYDRHLHTTVWELESNLKVDLLARHLLTRMLDILWRVLLLLKVQGATPSRLTLLCNKVMRQLGHPALPCQAVLTLILLDMNQTRAEARTFTQDRRVTALMTLY